MIRDLVRPELRDFTPYNPKVVPYKVKIDANESPFELPEKIRMKLADYFTKGPELNLYPDTNSNELRKVLASYWDIDYDGVIVGSGSDQLIQAITNVFVGKGDKVVCPEPTFDMYRFYTAIAGGIVIKIPLKEDKGFVYDINEFIETSNKENAKVVFLCSPNNPTGGLIPLGDIEKIAKALSKSIIVVDEAYAEFSRETAISLVKRYNNLIVLRTFSKAYGLAGIRCGYSLSSVEMADEINKVKIPFNISSLSQLVAKLVFEEREERNKEIEYIKLQRDYLMEELKKIKGIHPYPSEANFILLRVSDARKVCRLLLERGVLVRSFGSVPVLENFFRISIGNKEQNDIFLEELKSILSC